MFLTSGRPLGAARDVLCGTLSVSDVIAARVRADPAKATVMAHFGQLVGDGLAEWDLLESGDVEVRFPNGETFHLGDDAVTRVA
jgi:hypothetical protein